MNKPNKKKTSRQTRLCSGAKLKIEGKRRHEPAASQRSHNNLAAESAITVPMAPIDVAEARKKIESLVTASFEKIANALIQAAAAGKLAQQRSRRQGAL